MPPEPRPTPSLAGTAPAEKQRLDPLRRRIIASLQHIRAGRSNKNENALRTETLLLYRRIVSPAGYRVGRRVNVD
jgi:hypothetical protein